MIRCRTDRQALSRAWAFTLVELLVVIAVLSILAALLLPVLQRSLRSARTVACASQLKQIGTATLLYEDDGGALMPRGDLLCANRGNLRRLDDEIRAMAVWMRDYLGGTHDPTGDPDYTPDAYGLFVRFYASDLLICPFRTPPRATGFDAVRGRVYNFGGSTYGYHSGSASDRRVSLRLVTRVWNRARQAHEQMALGGVPALWADGCYTGSGGAGHRGLYVETNHKKPGAPAQGVYDQVANQYIEGGNVVHADGHVTWYRNRPLPGIRPNIPRIFHRWYGGSGQSLPVTACFPNVGYNTGGVQIGTSWLLGYRSSFSY